jgi:hypothetical protein
LLYYNFRRSEFLGCLTISVKSVLDTNILGTFLLQPQSCLTNPSTIIPEINEKFINFEETFRTIQSDNEDNMLLKYLELNDNFTSSEGRTPFTLTLSVKKDEKNSFGFIIADSKPPKIKAVLSQSELQKGDYIIFIGNINIVSMPFEDILSLIKSYNEEMITLEIFRPIEKVHSNVIIENLAALNTPIVKNNISSLNLDITHSQSRTSESITDTPTSHRACNFKQPKICFQPNVGNGVIV